MRDRLKSAIKSRFPVVVDLRDRLRGTAKTPDASPEEPPAPALARHEGADVVTAFTREQLDELIEEMVRPALQMDGGDIEVLRIDQGFVYVRLLGACVGCPSSRMTLQAGVERLFEEELDGFKALIEVPADLAEGPAV